MTLEDAFKAVVAAMFAALSSVAAWLANRVVADREELVHLKGEVAALKAAKAITLEDVRSVVEAALDRRDKIAEERREEWDRRLGLEIREAVREVCDHCPRSGDK